MISEIREVISKLKLIEGGIENALQGNSLNIENLHKQIAELTAIIESKDKLIEELKNGNG